MLSFNTFVISYCILLLSLAWIALAASQENKDDPLKYDWPLSMEPLEKILYEGRQQVDLIKGKVIQGGCYERLLSEFHSSCMDLNNEGKFRLALGMLNCQRVESGFKEIVCSPTESIHQCSQKMGSESNAYQTVVLLMHHVENMCYFVHSTQFQKQTSDTINLLASESKNVVKLLHALGDDHVVLKKQAQQTLAEQMKAYREHLKMSQSIENMKADNLAHQEKMETHYQSMMQKSQKLISEMDTLRDLQKSLNQRQEEVKNMVETHFENLKQRHLELSKSMDESIEISKLISKDQKMFSEHIQKLHEEQQNLFEKLIQSEEKQKLLLLGQDKLMQNQDVMYQSTLGIEKGIQKSNEALENMYQTSLKHHETLLSTVVDVSAQTKDVKMIQDKILNEARAGFQNLEDSTRTVTNNILAMHRNLEENFGKIFHFLQGAMELLSRIDFRLHVWGSVFFYAAAIVSIFFITLLERVKVSRVFCVLLWTATLAAEFHYPYHSRLIRTLFIFLSLSHIVYSGIRYRNYNAEAYKILLEIREKMKAESDMERSPSGFYGSKPLHIFDSRQTADTPGSPISYHGVHGAFSPRTPSHGNYYPSQKQYYSAFPHSPQLHYDGQLCESSFQRLPHSPQDIGNQLEQSSITRFLRQRVARKD